MIAMVDRFLEIENKIRIVLFDLQLPNDLSVENIEVLNIFVQKIRLLEIATVKLGERKSDLLVAERIFKFIKNKLRDIDFELAKEIKDKIISEFKSRKNRTLIEMDMSFKIDNKTLNDFYENIGYMKNSKEVLKSYLICFLAKLFDHGESKSSDPKNARK